jgi:hypothetical protein
MPPRSSAPRGSAAATMRVAAGSQIICYDSMLQIDRREQTEVYDYIG